MPSKDALTESDESRHPANEPFRANQQTVVEKKEEKKEKKIDDKYQVSPPRGYGAWLRCSDGTEYAVTMGEMTSIHESHVGDALAQNLTLFVDGEQLADPAAFLSTFKVSGRG